jgi:hypothetical protein
MSTNPTSLDDPALKAALRRELGGVVAPAALRAKLEAMVKAGPGGSVPVPAAAGVAPAAPTDTTTAGRVPGVAWARRMAVAAAVFIVATSVGGYLYQRHLDHEREEYLEANESNFRKMIAFADAPVAGGNLDDVRKQLGHAVATLGGDWQLAGSRLVDFNGKPAAALTYTRGTAGRSVTVFTIPVDALVEADELGAYEDAVDGRKIAGVVRDDWAYCFTHTAALTADELPDARRDLKLP